MITQAQFWMGRDIKYGGQLTPEIRRNGIKTVDLVNAL